MSLISFIVNMYINYYNKHRSLVRAWWQFFLELNWTPPPFSQKKGGVINQFKTNKHTEQYSLSHVTSLIRICCAIFLSAGKTKFYLNRTFKQLLCNMSITSVSIVHFLKEINNKRQRKRFKHKFICRWWR